MLFEFNDFKSFGRLYSVYVMTRNYFRMYFIIFCITWIYLNCYILILQITEYLVKYGIVPQRDNIIRGSFILFSFLIFLFWVVWPFWNLAWKNNCIIIFSNIFIPYVIVDFFRIFINIIYFIIVIGIERDTFTFDTMLQKKWNMLTLQAISCL